MHGPLKSAFCASFTFCLKANAESRSDYIFSPLQKLVCGCQVHNGHLLGCLQHLQLRQQNSDVARILELPGHNNNAKSRGGNQWIEYLITSSWSFQHSGAKGKLKAFPGALYFISHVFQQREGTQNDSANYEELTNYQEGWCPFIASIIPSY